MNPFLRVLEFLVDGVFYATGGAVMYVFSFGRCNAFKDKGKVFGIRNRLIAMNIVELLGFIFWFFVIALLVALA